MGERVATHHFVLVVCRRHLDHLLPLHAFVTNVNVGPPAPLIVADAFGHLSGPQLLEAVALGAEPLVNLLWAEESVAQSESVSRGRNRNYAARI